MNPISVIIPTFNEEDNIGPALDSVAWADELIVVDSFSEDRTVEIAQEKGATVLQHEYESPARQKNWATPQASHETILLLDADERITSSLKQEIQQILNLGMEHAAYWIPRQSHFMGKKIRFSGWQGDAVIRLIQKKNCHYPDVWVHEEIETTGSIGRLKNPMEHYTYRRMGNYMEKIDRYTTWGAYDRLEKTKKVTLYHLWVKPAFRFFRTYVLLLGILDGKQGFIISRLSAYTVFLRSLKLWRLKKGEKLKNPSA